MRQRSPGHLVLFLRGQIVLDIFPQSNQTWFLSDPLRSWPNSMPRRTQVHKDYPQSVTGPCRSQLPHDLRLRAHVRSLAYLTCYVLFRHQLMFTCPSSTHGSFSITVHPTKSTGYMICLRPGSPATCRLFFVKTYDRLLAWSSKKSQAPSLQ